MFKRRTFTLGAAAVALATLAGVGSALPASASPQAANGISGLGGIGGIGGINGISGILGGLFGWLHGPGFPGFPGIPGQPGHGVKPTPTTPTSAGNEGADVAFTEYSAVNARNNGSVIGPSYNLYTLPAEAVGRTAVTLSGKGKYVEFTLAKPANAVDLRYSIPDSADGAGLTTSLGVDVDGWHSTILALTSKYTWFYGSYPFSNNPADQHGHHMYDDVRAMFGRTLPAGTTVRFEATDSSVPVTIDVADFEQVASPISQPRGSLSVLSYGADPTGHKDSTVAIQNAINAGEKQHRTVYIPAGTFTVTGHLIVDDVTLTGAGEWYTVLHGAGVGVYGNAAPNASTNVHLSNFEILGEVDERVDADDVNGIGGAMGNSTIDHIWIQHTKVGMWFNGPFDGLKISDVRIQDTTADGINFDGGITNSSVTDTYVRNTGDDGLALWSAGTADSNDTFKNDTVVLPILANNFAIYGGHDNTITDDYATDTITQGGGIQVGNRFAAVPLSGTTTISRNTLVRTGTLDPNWKFGVGAIWFYASDEDMTGTVDVDDNTILDSPYDAFGFVGDYEPSLPPYFDRAISNVNIDGATVKNVGTFVVQLQSAGAATMSNVKATGVGLTGQMACGYGIVLTQGAGNSGWDTSSCQFPSFDILSLSTGALNFGLLDQGVQSPSQSVTVTNPGPDAASVGTISATGGFDVASSDCPASLAAGASCTVEVEITPQAVQTYSGMLVIPANTPFAPYTVGLSGAVYNPNGNLAATATASADNTLAGFPASNANDGSQDTYWQAADSSGSLELALAEPASVDRLVLNLPASWGDRDQTIAVDASTDGTNWTQVLAPAVYLFSPTNAAGANVVDIALPATTMRYVRLDVSDNTAQGAPQIAEFEVYAN